MARSPVIQVNEAKSGINGEEDFVVVYTLEDGRDTRPVTLDRRDAIDVALRFRAERKGDRELKINAAAAQFILGQIESAGWLEDAASEDETDDDGLLAPRYLPKIDPSVDPDVDEDRFADLVFVLAGVNPNMRTDPDAINAGSSLYDQFRETASRIPASDTMLKDHWYVISHLHDAGIDEFKKHWDVAKEHLGSHGATDFARLGRLLAEVQLDDRTMLDDPEHSSVLFEIRNGAVDLLYRQFRTVRRKLDEIHASADAKPKPKRKSLLGRLRKQESETSLFISEEAIKVTRRYLEVVVKLGRILRSDVLQRTTTNAPSAESA
ncbi:MAG: hypothetical protein AAFU85_02500 [Planctomycetota bacterium]